MGNIAGSFDRGVPRYAADGEFVGYIGTVIDLTDRKRAEEARQELAHASRLAILGELTAMVAHELNQPLSAILTNADAMMTLLDAQTVSVEELREILADIRRDYLRATEAIHHIRALAAKRKMEMRPLDVNELVADVVRLARSDALRRGVQIREEYSAKASPVQGDAVHLQQVMLNLILNSMDAMKDNAGSERKLWVSSACNSRGAVEVSVRRLRPGDST